MINKRHPTIVYLTVCAVLIGGLMFTAGTAEAAPLMTKEQLKGMLDNPDLIILDVRSGRDWKSSEFKIKGAVRANSGEFESWSGTYAKDKQIVLYCA